MAQDGPITSRRVSRRQSVFVLPRQGIPWPLQALAGGRPMNARQMADRKANGDTLTTHPENASTEKREYS